MVRVCQGRCRAHGGDYDSNADGYYGYCGRCDAYCSGAAADDYIIE